MISKLLDALRPAPVPSRAPASQTGGAFEQSLLRASGGSTPPATPHAQALDLLAAQQASNMQYLALQHALGTPKQSVISNVLKVRHETAKNAIGNLR